MVVGDRQVYVLTFKELVDKVVRDFIAKEVFKEAKKTFKPEEYQEMRMHAIKRLTELGISVKELEESLG